MLQLCYITTNLVNNGEKSFTQALEELVEIEKKENQKRRDLANVKVANFPFLKTFDDYEFDFRKRSITCTLIFKRSFFYDLFLMFAGRLGDHGRRYSRNERSVSSMCFGISVSRYSKYSYGFKLLAFAVSAML